MPELKRQPARHPDPAYEDDPLVELARIVSGNAPFPEPQQPQRRPRVEPPAAVTQARAEIARQPMPNKLSALEQELFSELRSTVDPDRAPRVRVEPAAPEPPPAPRVVPMPPPSHAAAASAAPRAEPAASGQDFASHLAAEAYRYPSSGVAAGSYDPAFDDFFEEPTLLIDPHQPPADPGAADPRARAAGYPQPTFQDFGREEIAAAAREAQPFPGSETVLPAHPAAERAAARRVAREEPKRGLMLAGAALGVFVMAGLGFLGWRAFAGVQGDGAVPLVAADVKPMKVKPEGQPTAPTGPDLSAGKVEDASRLVTRQEDPVEQVNGRTADGRNVRVIPGAPNPSVTEQPRTVRTVVVRPDGTIMQPGEPPRAVQTTPMRSNDPATLGATISVTPAPPPPSAAAAARSADPIAALSQPASPRVAPAPTVTETPAPVAALPPPPAPPAPAPAPAPARTVTTQPIAAPAPVQPRPTVPVRPAASQPLPPATGAPLPLGPVAPTRLASTGPAPAAMAPAAAAPTPPAPIAAPPVAARDGGGDGQYVVQISSQRSDADARRAYSEAQRKYPSALAGRPLDVQVANLGARGTYYRVRAVAGSRDEATQICAQMKAQGAECIVGRR